MVALFLASLDSLELNAEQKTTVDGIKADLVNHAEAAKEPREKLEADVIAGVTAGKLDQAKVDADIRAMSAAVAATQPAMQEDLNRLHKALTPEQRKKLVATVREKGKEMHEHGMAMHQHEAKGGEHEHEHQHPHGKDMAEGPVTKLSEELDLTPEQATKLRGKVEALVKAQQAAMKGKMAAAAKQMAGVGAAFESDKFDAKKAGVGSQAPDLVRSIAADRVQFVQAVLSVLTPEQRPKFVAHLQAHFAEMD